MGAGVSPNPGHLLQVWVQLCRCRGRRGRMTRLLIHSSNTAALAPELSPDRGGPALSSSDPGRTHRARLWAGSDRPV